MSMNNITRYDLEEFNVLITTNDFACLPRSNKIISISETQVTKSVKAKSIK